MVDYGLKGRVSFNCGDSIINTALSREEKMNTKLSERDIRTIENLARTGMGFDDLRDAFVQFPYEEIEKVYMRVRKETVGDIQAGTKINCS